MRRVLGHFLPGLSHWVAGRRIEGGIAMLLWVWLLSLFVFRFSRVAGALTGELDQRVALLTLLGGLGCVWWWSFRGQAGAEKSGSASLDGRDGGFWNRFKENRMALVGLLVVAACALTALLTPFLTPFDPAYSPAYQGGEMGLRLLAPSAAHFLGTDHLARDLFSRILYGSRVSLSIGILVVAISIPMGTLLGAVAGYMGGWVDTVIMRTVDTFMAFPRIVLLIILVALFHPSISLLVAALALTQWPSSTRIVRGEVLALREREFVEAARALGFSSPRIIFRHILPNALPSIIVAASLGIGNTIVMEAGLSFLGLGVQAPGFSWGTMVRDGRGYLLDAWWMATFPGLAIVLVVLAFNLVGDGLRDAMDPRQGEGSRP